MPRRARFSKRKVERAAPAPSEPIWLLCDNDGTSHPVFCTPDDAFPNRIIARAAWNVLRAACWASAERDGSKPPFAATVYDGITALSHGSFATHADGEVRVGGTQLKLLRREQGFTGLRLWDETLDPDGMFELFVAATETDIANAIADKALFPEIAAPLDAYVQALQIRREIVAEGRDRSGARNPELRKSIQDFERSQQL